MHTMKREAGRSGKLVIAEGGGPTAVINQSLAGAVLEARLFPQIERIYGARYGVRGIVNEDFVDFQLKRTPTSKRSPLPRPLPWARRATSPILPIAGTSSHR